MTYPAFPYRDLNKQERNDIRQCNNIILKHYGIPWKMRQRVRDFRPSKIALIIKTLSN